MPKTTRDIVDQIRSDLEKKAKVYTRAEIAEYARKNGYPPSVVPKDDKPPKDEVAQEDEAR
jgi:hypothetical protein